METAVKRPVKGATRSIRAVVREVGRRNNRLPPTRFVIDFLAIQCRDHLERRKFEMTTQEAFVRVKRQYKNGSIRRIQIMDSVVSILGEPVQSRFTTKEIAAKIGVSEACLYRHFSGKAQILGEVLKRSAQLLDITLRSADAYPQVSMINRAYLKLRYLLLFAEKNPGLTRVLTGEALIYEEANLSGEKEKVLKMIRESIKNSLVLASVNREISAVFDAQARAQVILDFVVAQWLRFSQSGFTEQPTALLDQAAPVLFSFN